MRAGAASQMKGVRMVNPFEILPVLLMALSIVLVPLISDGPPG